MTGSWCMPMVEAKRYISSTFEVVSFALTDGSASALLREAASKTLYHVQYVATIGGDMACFAPILGGQGV